MELTNEIQIRFLDGTLLITGLAEDIALRIPLLVYDKRVSAFRAEAIHYRELVELFVNEKVVYKDNAKEYVPYRLELKDSRKPFAYQTEALESWWKARGRGVVILPTGTGKTFLAILAIWKSTRPTMVITPTIDLMNQWYQVLEAAFQVPVGMIGGGSHDLKPLTVTTYDSAHIHLGKWGNKAGLVVFDECHHLPGPMYSTIARGSLAPYRLGLSATPERSDGQETLLDELIGPICFRKEIGEFTGEFLANYESKRVFVELEPSEATTYQESRKTYRDYLNRKGINLGMPNGWARFLFEASRSEEGRKAIEAFRLQKKIAFHAEAKIEKLKELLLQHREDPSIIFCSDNQKVYEISRKLLIPAITHETKARERRGILERFKSGIFSAIVTNKVLNEGVDVPSARVGIILSGSGTVREHVQRLGRILRKHKDKEAVLYEIITRNTSEEYTSDRRRQHDAYRQ
ncbi:MAG: DEAD/DEAH box helicase [Planctomycetia bacterium]